MIDPKREEARLVRRIAHLRMLSRHTDDARIAVALDELIADTENQIVRLKPQEQRHAALTFVDAGTLPKRTVVPPCARS